MVSVAASPSEKFSGSVVSGDVQVAFFDARGFHKSWMRLESEVRATFFSQLSAFSFSLISSSPEMPVVSFYPSAYPECRCPKPPR
jgi:hypothetical protein